MFERSWATKLKNRSTVLSVFLLVFSTILAAVLIIAKSGPAIFGDELGYLSAGRVLAGKGAIFMGGGTTYHPGTGLIYSLAFRLFDGPAEIYSSVVVLNVVQIGIALFLLCRVSIRLGLNGVNPLIIAPLLWVFGGLLFYASFAMAEATVCLAFAGLLYFITSLQLGKKSQFHFALIAFAHGFAWIVHPRFIVITAVFLLSLVVSKTYKALPSATIFSLAGLLVARLFVAQVTGSIYGPSTDNLVAPIQSIMVLNIEGLIFGFLAKVVYLSISSCGFFLFGFHAIMRLPKNLKFFKFYLLTSIIAVLLYTSKSLTFDSDPKFFFYGRYVEPLTVIVTLFGLLSFLQQQKIRDAITAKLSLLLVFLAGIFWLKFRNDGRTYQISNSPGFIFLAEISSRPEIYLSVFLFSFLLMMLFLIGQRRPVVTLIFVGGIAVTTAIMQITYSFQLAEMQPRHAEFVSNVKKIDEKWGNLSVDRTGGRNPWGHIYGTQWWASEFDAQFHSQGGDFSNGVLPDVLIHAGSNTPAEYELVAADKWTNFSMWALENQGTGVGLRHPKDMPAEGLRGALGGRFSRNGDVVRGEVIIENQSDYQWFPAGGTFGSMGCIRVVLNFHLNGEVILTERVDLVGMLWPGQEELLTFEFQNLGDFDRITAEGVHEGVRWFSQVGITPSELERLE